MQPPKQHSWINLVEIKGQLVKKLGLERSKQYFEYLNQFLSLELSKNEFDRVCLGTIGKDNIRLHNQLIHAVLKNACTVTVGNTKPLDGFYHQNGSVPVVAPVTNPLTSPLNLANGSILPPSPREATTGARDQRVVDCKIALVPIGSSNFTPFSSSAPQTGDFHVVLKNGESSSPNHQELMKLAENGAHVSVNPVEQTESLVKRDGKIISDRTSLHAPLGVPLFPIAIGGTHMGNNSKCVGVLHTDGLLDTTTLKERIEQIITLHGLQQVSLDCANMLNTGLDVYLKGLIRSCVELNGSRSSFHKPIQSDSLKHSNHIRSLNGGGQCHHHQMQEQERKPKRLVSLLDFKVAMELNCKQLGDEWPILLGKICCTYDFEE